MADSVSQLVDRDGPIQPKQKQEKAQIWWSNMIFFISMHVVAALGIFKLSPWYDLDRRTLIMCVMSWQLATFGITVGYHRLWSHRAFTAKLPLRIVLAGMGCLGFQGSIKWWVLRHRLHHRFTDTEHDPYNANQGLYHSHMGWIFRKPNYPKMAIIDRKDLDADPVVRFQHRYYVPLTLTLGLVAPTLIGWSYGDALGGYIWGGVVARIMIWHCTFLINSLAHYLGDQAYSHDVTARGNFLLAIFTGGEANHNFHHAFPRDYRNGPRWSDFDASKWLIWALYHLTPWIPKLHQTSDVDILRARAHVLAQEADQAKSSDDDTSSFAFWSSYASATSDASSDPDSASTSQDESWPSDADKLFDEAPPASKRRRTTRPVLPKWTRADLTRILEKSPRRNLLVIIDGFVVDVTSYAQDHPGGQIVLRKFAARPDKVLDASEAFNGGLNQHGWTARDKMSALRIAHFVDAP